MFSRRSSFERRPNALHRAQASRDPSRAVFDLTLTNPTRAGLAYPEAELVAALADREDLEYRPESFGRWSARAAIADAWRARGHEVPPERIVLTASTSEAYAMLFKLLCDPGDHVLVPAPSYPLFDQLAQLEDVELRPYPLHYAGEWHLAVAELERLVTERTRAVIVVNPNNPTGSFLKQDELEALVRLGLPIVSDEVFADYPLCDDPRRVETALSAGDALVFALGGLSKSAGLPQLKLAWTSVGGPGPLVTEALARLEIVLDVFLSPGAAVQRALPRLLAAGATTRASIQARIARNLRRAEQVVAGSAVSALRVEGGWSAVLRLPNTLAEERWVLDLLEHGVLVQPGYFYDFATEPFVVVSLLTEEATFEAGLSRLVERVEQTLG